MPGISLNDPILYTVTPAVDTIDLPGSHINIGNFKLFFLQASITESEIVFTHSSIDGGSSSSVYLIPKPPPTFRSLFLQDLYEVLVQKFENQYVHANQLILDVSYF